MKSTKSFKILISVLASFIAMLLVAAAIPFFTVNKVYATENNNYASLVLTVVADDQGTPLTEPLDITKGNGPSGNVYVKLSVKNPTGFKCAGIGGVFTYNSDLLTIVKLGPAASDPKKQDCHKSLLANAGITSGIKFTSRDIDDPRDPEEEGGELQGHMRGINITVIENNTTRRGIAGDFDVAIFAFTVDDSAVGSADFKLLTYGSKKMCLTTMSLASEVVAAYSEFTEDDITNNGLPLNKPYFHSSSTPLGVREVVNNPELDASTIEVRKGSATGTVLAHTYNAPTHTITVTDKLDYNDTDIYVSATPQDSHAKVTGNLNAVNTVTWGGADVFTGTIANAFTITGELTGSDPVNYTIEVERNKDTDTSGTFGISTTTVNYSKSVTSDTLAYTDCNDIPNAERTAVTFTFAGNSTSSGATLTYQKGTDTPVTVSTSGSTVSLTSGDYVATLTITAQDTTKSAVYTFAFKVVANDNKVGSLKIEAGSNGICSSDNISAGGTIDTTVAYADRNNVKFTFSGKVDSTATLTYQKGTDSPVTVENSGDVVQLVSGTYTVTLEVTAEDGTKGTYAFTLTVDEPDTDKTGTIKIEAGNSTPKNSICNETLDSNVTAPITATNHVGNDEKADVVITYSKNSAKSQIEVTYKTKSAAGDGTAVVSGTKLSELAPGEYEVNVKITSEDASSTTYTVYFTVDANNNMNGTATIAAGDSFNETKSLTPTQTSISAGKIPNADRSNVVFTFSKEHALSSVTATLTKNGTSTTENITTGASKSLDPGAYTFTVTVTAESGNYTNYVIEFSVASNSNKSGTLKIEAGSATIDNITLSETGYNAAINANKSVPNADKGTVKFTATVDATTSNADITYKLKSAAGDGTTVESGTAIPLAPGEYVITVKITAEDNSDKSYEINLVVDKSSNANATLKIEAGTTTIYNNTNIAATDHNKPITIPTKIADADKGTVKFTFEKADPNASAIVLTYKKGDETPKNATSGGVVALENGDYTLTLVVTAEDGTTVGNYIFNLTVDVTNVTGVTLDKSNEKVNVGGTLTLTATVAPANATDNSVTWTSSDPTIASVTGGVVTAIKKGTVTITVTTTDGGKTASCTVEVVVPATGVTLDLTEKTLKVGEFVTLHETVAPADASVKTVTWTSSDSTVASVDATGKVTANKVGSATITATVDGTTIKETCAITVVPATIAVTGVTVDVTKTLEIGEDFTLTATVAPTDASNKAVTWASDKTAVATVDNTGKVTAVSAGVAIITVTTADGNKTANCVVIVNAKVVAVTGVTLNESTLTLTVEQMAALKATVAPANADNKAVTWTSSDATVASVDGGVVTALKAGTTTITVTTADGNKTATCTVTVNAKPPVVTTVAVTGVTLDKSTLTLTVEQMAALKATVAPAEATNKAVTWTSSDATVASVDGGVVTALKAGTTTITVTTADGNKTATCTVTVNAKQDTGIPVGPGTTTESVSVVVVGAADKTITSEELNDNTKACDIALVNVDNNATSMKITFNLPTTGNFKVTSMSSSASADASKAGAFDLTLEEGLNTYVFLITDTDSGVYKTVVVKCEKPSSNLVMLIALIVVCVAFIIVTVVMVVYIAKNSSNKKRIKAMEEKEKEDKADKND